MISAIKHGELEIDEKKSEPLSCCDGSRSPFSKAQDNDGNIRSIRSSGQVVLRAFDHRRSLMKSPKPPLQLDETVR